ncbi:MAG: helix-turn-helix domain-containing protein [Clostridia bacterium]|nr:helix-turn-helix domain-containing protein [Clostridia bacterium]
MKTAKNGFGVRLKKLRKSAGMTQSDLADRLLKSSSAVRMWELGANEPDINTLVELSAIFDCSLDYLLCRDAILGKEGAVRTSVPVYKLSDFRKDDDAIYYQTLAPDYLEGNAAYVICLNDTDDLLPQIPNGATILIRLQEACLDGQLVLIRIGERYYIRRISFCDGGMVFSGAFPRTPVFYAAADDPDVEIVGVAVEFSMQF